jgi:hypothetical protein
MRSPRSLIKAVTAGALASITHAALMWMKTYSGALPEFQPYSDLQRTLTSLTGAFVPQSLLWVLGLINGALILGPSQHWTYNLLPGRGWIAKGLVFGILAWVFMGLVLFPLIGEGFFGLSVGRGILPSLQALIMMLVYSLTLSAIYSVLAGPTPSLRSRTR